MKLEKYVSLEVIGMDVWKSVEVEFGGPCAVIHIGMMLTPVLFANNWDTLVMV